MNLRHSNKLADPITPIRTPHILPLQLLDIITRRLNKEDLKAQHLREPLVDLVILLIALKDRLALHKSIIWVLSIEVEEYLALLNVGQAAGVLEVDF